MSEAESEPLEPRPGDALVLVDVQNDFLTGGSLSVPEGDAIIPVLNGWIRRFRAEGLPVYATRDWHPADHCSFREQGGDWPPHCVAGSKGAEFSSELTLPPDTVVISKAITAEKEVFSDFEATDFARQLRESGVRRLFVGGLATDYCVRATVLDGLRNGFEVIVLRAAVRAVDVKPGDGERAMREMLEAGAVAA